MMNMQGGGGLMGPGMAILQAALKQPQQKAGAAGPVSPQGMLSDMFTPKPDGLIMMIRKMMQGQQQPGAAATPPATPAASPLAGLSMSPGGLGAPLSLSPPAMGGGFMPDIAGGLGY